jgi:membrane protein DedA with SNARE-associated domain
MTETALALVADYGVIILFCVTFLTCLALPVPSSILMLAPGSFAATGDLDIVHVAVAAFAGAVLGDNTGYVITRLSGDRMRGWLDGDPKRAALHNKGATFMTKWGGSSVFFSCWLVAPLGPYINYIRGLTKFTWARFALWGIAVEVVWVGLYVGLGFTFGENFAAIASLLGNASGLIKALVMTIGLRFWLIHAARAKNDKTASA